VNERTRNRVVGAVILVSLAAIFLPMLLDGEGLERREVPRMPAGDLRSTPSDEIIDPADEDWAFVDEARRQRDRAEPLDGRPVHLPAPGTGGRDGAEAGETAAAADSDAAAEPGGEGTVDVPGPDAGLDTALADDGMPLAWSVQLATFASRDNARALRERLLDDGYEAYLIPAREAERTLYRVAIGPRLDRNAAARLEAELEQRYELDGLVVQFSLAGLRGDG
jgi:DedD protein